MIAAGNNTRSEIENVIGADIGGYLTKLEGEYRLVSKELPVCEVKRNGEKISLDALSEKAETFHRATGGYSNYQADYVALPMSEM